MRPKLGLIALLAVCFLAGSHTLFAHHGNASYDTSKTVTVTGTVTEYHWANPHVFVKVDAKDENGNLMHWSIETQNIVTEVNAGWTKDTFKPGDQVIIDITPAKNGAPFGRFKGRIVINGQTFKSADQR